MTYQHLPERGWKEPLDADMSPARSRVTKMRTRLAHQADNPTYILTESQEEYPVPDGRAGERWVTDPPQVTRSHFKNTD